MSKLPVSVVILTKDEERHLPRCLKSITHFADQILVVDSHSTDKTLAIAREFGAETIEHDFTNQAEQFNWALANLNIKNEWVLRLDADEYILPELWSEIAQTLPQTPAAVAGFYLKRRVHFMGCWIRHGGYYPSWFLRLFRKGQARSETRPMDEHLFLLSGRAEKLQNDFVDESHITLTEWTAKHNIYASREAEARLAGEGWRGSDEVEKQRAFRHDLYEHLPLFTGPFLYFFWRYFLRLGFLDGIPGLIFHFLQGFWYRFLVDAKLYEARHGFQKRT